MKKVAIVGVEGSGKTVMLAGLGKYFSLPDANGYYFEPQDQETVRYIRNQCEKLENGKWPPSTPPDVSYGLNCHLKQKCESGKAKTVAQISCLDFAGEVYRMAFNARQSGIAASRKDTVRLKKYVASADEVVVLVNLRDAISGTGDTVRAAETEFMVLQLLKYVLEELKGPKPRVLLALSQSDMYSETIAACGGPRQVLEKYLPTVALAFGYLDVVAIHSVDKTSLDVNGDVVPAKGCSPVGLRPMVDWLLLSIRGFKGRIRSLQWGVQRHVTVWRLFGMLAIIVGVIGTVSIAFDSWLGNWDVEFERHYHSYQPPPPPIPKFTWYKPMTWSPSQPPIPPKVEWVDDFDVPVFSDGWSWPLFFCVVCGVLALAGFSLCISARREERANLTCRERFRIPLVLMVLFLSGLSTLLIRIWVAASSNRIYVNGDTVHRYFINKYMPMLLMGDWGYFFCCVASVLLTLVFVFLTFRRISDGLRDVSS